MCYDEFGVYHVQQTETRFDGPNEWYNQKVDSYLDIDIYQIDDEWVCYVSKPNGNVDYVLIRRETNEFWDFDRFLKLCIANTQQSFDYIKKNLDMLEAIYETIKEEL